MPSDPQREFAVDVVKRLRDRGYQALWAGGCVRDLLLGLPPKDYDVATDARPDDVRNVFGRRNTHGVGASFGVILVRGPREAGQIEVATFRSEGPYLDGRRPESVSFTSPEEDARRRDFTINGMFYDPLEQRVLDYVGGEQDLSAGIIRAIGDPRARMREDKLRMLRAVRFTATLDFQLDPVTADAVREMAAEIHVVSAERIAQELKRMLVDAHRRRAIELCRDVALLPEFLPESRQLWITPDGSGGNTLWDRTLHMLHLLQSPGLELAFACLLHGATDRESAEAVCRRLRLSNDETERVAWLVGNQNALDDAPQLAQSRLKRLLAHPWIADLLALSRVRLLATNSDPQPVFYCEELLRNTPREIIDPPPLLTGDDLIELGLKPGPRFREILEQVRDAQLDGRISTRDEALALARKAAGSGD